ncbi:MAG: Trk system potassium transporter TrkA [Clostridia bacterium]|nr:Trk system potassium transporter TrkA [Clostridia bacterium]
MNIIISGYGKIGDILIRNLTEEGHNIVVIDKDSYVLTQATNLYDVMCVCGNGADYDTLMNANVKNADIYIAVTGSDELNMLGCFLARKLGAKHTIARIRTPEYNDNNEGFNFLKQQLDLSLVINPEQLAAKELFNILKFPSAVNIEHFARRKFEMVEIILKSDSVLNGMSLIELRKKFSENFLVCVVRRGDTVYIPDGNFRLQAGDKIGLTASPAEIQKLLKKLSILKKKARNIMILGGSRTAYYLSRLLISSGNNVKIIEKDKKRCEVLSSLLPESTVIFGDGANQEVLMEEGLLSMDAFISLTDMDEENILISSFASSHNVSKVISKVNRTALSNLAEKFGLDCIVSPKKMISDVIVRYARALQNTEGSKMETLYKIMDGKAEAVEFVVEDSFNHVNVPLKDLSLKPDTIIGGIIRGRKAIIPSGNDVIMPNDRVIVIVAGQNMDDLSDIIK